ncbi:Putative DNA-binding domain,Cation efflux protein,XPA C- terminal [Cinara cedri]|uniref:DNA-binding domain,Cation efflux protein,XPA C- terminal n=1 Tax=Cinara cedri TaxID=506608 RepID=A0A5E4NC17_9HEMI|nr:Putative DNA-binding domain,Cation efflux protein,XPA C- terminal [Cinara cedri]
MTIFYKNLSLPCKCILSSMNNDPVLIRKCSQYVFRYKKNEISMAKNHLWPIRCYATMNDDDKNGNGNSNGNDSSKLKSEDKVPVLKSVPLKEILDKVNLEKDCIKTQRPEKSVDRNYITARRAMTEFMLKSTDLEGLKTIKRRSPFEDEPPINVYWRKDVVAKASEVWGSQEDLVTQLIKREIDRKKKQQTMFTIKAHRRSNRRQNLSQNDLKTQKSSGLFGASGRVVLTAVVINGLNTIFKGLAWSCTGSHSMFSECIHSMADTVNQVILAFGIYKSVQIADSYHPYGYSNMKYVASLISGVGIFCIGSGLSIYHGVTGLIHAEPLDSLYWGYVVLGISFVSEGATLGVAINNIVKCSKEAKISFLQYVLRGHDPTVNVVLLEDCAAVLSIGVAGICMSLTSYLNSPIPDAVGSLLVGGILGTVASFIIYTNTSAIVGRSISQTYLNKINAELESDIMIRAIHDVKGIDMGNSLIRYKAELDFDGRELAKQYLDRLDPEALMAEVKKIENADFAEAFLLKHSENIIDMIGGEIDRIEWQLRSKFPEIRHCDLEIL